MYKNRGKKVASLQEVIEEFLPLNQNLEVVCAKELFPECNTNSVTLQFAKLLSPKTFLTVSEHIVYLENLTDTSIREFELLSRLKVQPRSASASEFAHFIGLCFESIDAIEDTRFFLFYTLDRKRRVVDIAIDQKTLYLSIMPCDHSDNFAFYQQLVREDPNDYELKALFYLEVFESCIFGNDIQDRLANINRLKALRPGDSKSSADIQYCYAMIEFKIGNSTAALIHLHKAVEHFPDHYASLEQLATQYFHEHNFTEALKYYDRAIALGVDNGRNMAARRIECVRAMSR